MTPLLLFGGSGDLARAKVLPAILRLRRDGLFPAGAPLVFAARRALDVGDLLRAAALRAPDAAGARGSLLADARAVELPLGDEGAARAADLSAGAAAYAALPPSALADLLRTAGALRASGKLARLAIEKPLGRDGGEAASLLARARAALGDDFFLVDHYAWKAAARGLGALPDGRLPAAAATRALDLAMSETLRVGRRAAFYDEVGATRDVFQSHGLFLIAAAIAKISGATRSAALASLSAVAARRARYVGYEDEGGAAPEVETAAKVFLKSALLPEATISATFGKALPAARVALSAATGEGVWTLEVQPEASLAGPGAGARDRFAPAGEGYDAYEGALAAALSGDFSAAPSPEDALVAWEVADAARRLAAAEPLLRYVPGEDPAW